MDISRASLNSITVRDANLNELLRLASTHHIPGVALWRDVYTHMGVAQAASRIRDSGRRVTSICRGGMFTHTYSRDRKRTWDDNRRAVEETRELDAECLVLVCGGAPSGDLPAAREQIAQGVNDLADYAASYDVKLAIEPMHPMMVADRSAITSLREANDLVSQLRHPQVGIALDAYHVFWDSHLKEELTRAQGHLHSVQVCDWVTPIHHQLSSRGMPGEGSIDLSEFLNMTAAAGYTGLIEIEVLSDSWWAASPQEAAEAAVQGFLKI